jgi:hypothetical protein
MSLSRIRQQRAVVAVEDVHGQVRVRPRQLLDQLLLKGLVDAVPERAAPPRDVA